MLVMESPGTTDNLAPRVDVVDIEMYYLAKACPSFSLHLALQDPAILDIYPLIHLYRNGHLHLSLVPTYLALASPRIVYLLSAIYHM